jgi:ABC-2 type transport system permease protein
MTVISAPPRPASAASRIRWALADSVTIIRRHLLQFRHTPGELAGELIFPIAMVLLFGYVFGSAISVPGGAYKSYLMPGLYAMTTMASVMSASVAVAADSARGVMDRFRSMPMARLAVMAGRTGADILTGTLTLAVMVGCGFAVGWRPDRGIPDTLAAFGLLILFRYALSWGGVLLGLSVSEELADKLTPLVFPLTMISNAFVPTQNMTPWLRDVANWNPISALVAALRQLFGNAQATGASTLPWPLTHPYTATLLWAAAFVIVFVPLTVRRFRTAFD